MTTVIDSLVIELGLDPTKLTRGQQEALESFRKTNDAALKQANEIESHAKKTFDLLANLRREALTALGLFFGGAGIKDVIDGITGLDASTGRLAKTLGMATEETSAWQGAIRQAGGTTEGASAALSGLSGEMNRFQLTGQSGMLPVLSRLGISLYDQNRNLKTAGQLWLDLADAVQGMDPRQAAAFLQMVPGANQDMINFALLGRRAMESYLAAARSAGVTTRESAQEAQEYRRQVELLDSSAQGLGRTLVTMVAPAITTVMNGLHGLLQAWNTQAGSAKDVEQSAGLRKKVIDRFGSPADFMRWIANNPEHSAIDAWVRRKADQWYGAPGADQANAAGIATQGRAQASRVRTTEANASAGPSEMEAYIRRQAAARGIDPEVAVAVARSEGLYNWKSTVPGEESYGPYQLHYGGLGQRPGMAASGLGDVFTRQTGLDARDRSTWHQQVDFSLGWAKTHGWGDWHGWRGAPFAGIGGGAGGSSTSVSIGSVVVNTRATDAQGIANDIGPALKRSITAASANAGPQ